MKMDQIIISWSKFNVAQWLQSAGLDKFAQFFLENEIDGLMLLTLNKEDLFMLSKTYNDSFVLADAIKLDRALEKLKASNASEFVAPFGLAAIGELPFGLADSGFGEDAAANLESHALVPVSTEPKWKDGGFEDTIRIMEETYPNYSWRYKSIDVLFKDYIPLDGVIKGDGDITTAFPSIVTHAISPVEFYIQPTMMDAQIKKLQQQLQEAYSDSTSAVPRENIFVGMACVTRYKEDGLWYRAQVVDVVGTEEAPVKFIDWGNRQYSKFDELKPLRTELGRLPPFALVCRIEGVRERTLEQKVLTAFHKKLDDLGGELLTLITSSTTEPFLVQIYNKFTKENIGRKYLPKEPICPKIPAAALKKMRERERAENECSSEEATASAIGVMKIFTSDIEAVMEGAIGDYSSSDDGQTGVIKRDNKRIRKYRLQEQLTAQGKWPPKSAGDDERARLTTMPNSDLVFQRCFRKQRKPLSGLLDIQITHTESAKEVYVRILAIQEANMEEALKEKYGDQNDSTVPSLPADLVAVNNACVVYYPVDRQFYRCRILEISQSGVTLQTVDIGKRLQTILPPSEYGRMKVLLCGSCLESAPYVYECRINQLCVEPISATETELLRELLPPGKPMKAKFERSNAPYRITMMYPKGMDFVCYFNATLEGRGLREQVDMEKRPCTDVALYRNGPTK